MDTVFGMIGKYLSKDSDTQWNHTKVVELRMMTNARYEEPDSEAKHGMYGGRRIIGRDTPIQGGVYLGSGKREAIVVDDTYNESTLLETYRDFIKRINFEDKKYKDNILEKVFNYVRTVLPYNESEVKNIITPLQKDQKVALDVFIDNKAGVCRHQALLVAYILEKMKSERHLNGTASIDRNTIPSQGGHAWVRYVNGAGKILIIDPAQNFIGSLEDSLRERNSGGWDYERASDIGRRFVSELPKRIFSRIRS